MHVRTGSQSLHDSQPSRACLWALPVLALIIIFLAGAGCTGVRTAPVTPTPSLVAVSGNHTVTKVDLVFFHPVPGCDSCDQVGRYANETVTTYFAPELARGNLTYRDVNLNLPESSLLAKQYGAYDNSLWMGVHDETGFHATEITDIWYYAYNHDAFMQYLKGILQRQLAGTP